MKHKMSVEHHDGHAQAGNDGAQGLHTRDGLRLPVEHGEEKHGEEGAAADDERRVRRCGVEHRRILSQEIDRTTRHAQRHHQQLVAPRGAKEMRDER